MLRFGIVSQIDPINVQARVSFEDDESTSYWLPILQTKTLKDKFYAMPDIGEQVACLMDEYTLNYYMISSHTTRHFNSSMRVWFKRLKLITLPRELVIREFEE